VELKTFKPLFMNNLPVFKAAAVQAAPCFLDSDATIAKASRLIAEAAGNGAKLVVFPEVFVPGYPYDRPPLSGPGGMLV